MENKGNLADLSQVHFRYLNAEEVANPFIYLNEFCERETELCHFRQDILDLLKTAYSFNEEFYSGASPSHGYYQQQLIKLIEAIYVLTVQKVSLSARANVGVANDYRFLNAFEQQEIYHFLNDFFEYKDLDNWREYLDDILIHAYKEGGVGYFEYDKTPFKSMNMLGKFAEALFLIYEITSTARTESVFRAASVDKKDDKEEDNMDKGNSDDPNEFVRAGECKAAKTADGVIDSEKCEIRTNGKKELDEELPNRLHEEVLQFFSLVDPRFIGEGLRYILMIYLQEGFERGFGKEAMLAELMYPLQRLFELFDVARRETSHWGNMRIGSDFVN